MSDVWLVTSIKNEAPWLLEWISYHRAIGFDRMLVYTNDNTDLTAELLQALEPLDWFEWVPNELNGSQSPQGVALDKAYRRLQDSDDWVFFADADEFLNLKKHNNVKEFLRDYSDCSGVAINWKVFGSDGREQRGDGYVIERFLRCASSQHPSGRHIKSFTRMNQLWRGLGLHRPLIKTSAIITDNMLVYTNKYQHDLLVQGSATNSPEFPILHDIAQVNHYMVKSKAEYALKQRRGNGFRMDRSHAYSDKYFAMHDINQESDKTILRFFDSMRSVYSCLLKELNLYSLMEMIDEEYREFEIGFLKSLPGLHESEPR